MIHDGADEAFHAADLVVVAKAMMRNHEFLSLLDQRFPEEPLPETEEAQPETAEPRPEHERVSRKNLQQLSDAFSHGIPLEMRRLCSNATDEAIDNRLKRVLQRIGAVGDVKRDNVRADPHAYLDLLFPLLRALGEVFLCEGNDASIRVRMRHLGLWQDLILVVPPLLIMAAWMTERLMDRDQIPPEPSRRRELNERLSHWLCDSTLPVDDNPLLDYICRTHGLDETHMHLNGTTEAEKVWVDALKTPKDVFKKLHKRKSRDTGLHASMGDGVSRLFRQEDPALTGNDRLYRRVRIAPLLKAALLENTAKKPLALWKCEQQVLARGGLSSASVVVKEAWQLCWIFKTFASGKANTQDKLNLWHYVLLRAQFCRLLVQQADQYGFDQFQYIADNELREHTEEKYAERFRQIERGHQKWIDHLEGRFAPKKTGPETTDIIARILKGYRQFLQEDELGKAPRTAARNCESSLARIVDDIRDLEDQVPSKTSRRLRLGLVAHFIKKKDEDQKKRFLEDKCRPICRSYRVRCEMDKTARGLVFALESTSGLSQFLRGVDAASNERHAAPEVFAPAFRRMREAGIRRFTYHAGEDFAHLASGLRAIKEVIDFFEFGSGCRIGHGTAAGLDVKAWWDCVGSHVVMPCEDRLDDLLFARHMIRAHHVSRSQLPLIESEIQRLAQHIWRDTSISADDLGRAWLLRHLDPLAQETSPYEVEKHRKSEWRRFEKAKQSDGVAHKLFLMRHGVGARKEQLERAWEEIVISREADVLDEGVLRDLQGCVLSELRQRQIAIETLPSSNVRISIHNSYDHHHARNWLPSRQDGAVGSACFVLGSDDPGIFATNLRMEYAHFLRPLRNHCDAMQDPDQAENMLEKICLDAKKFRF